MKSKKAETEVVVNALREFGELLGMLQDIATALGRGEQFKQFLDTWKLESGHDLLLTLQRRLHKQTAYTKKLEKVIGKQAAKLEARDERIAALESVIDANGRAWTNNLCAWMTLMPPSDNDKIEQMRRRIVQLEEEARTR